MAGTMCPFALALAFMVIGLPAAAADHWVASEQRDDACAGANELASEEAKQKNTCVSLRCEIKKSCKILVPGFSGTVGRQPDLWGCGASSADVREACAVPAGIFDAKAAFAQGSARKARR